MPPYLHTEALFHYLGIIAHSFAAVGVERSVIGSKATLPGKAGMIPCKRIVHTMLLITDLDYHCLGQYVRPAKLNTVMT